MKIENKISCSLVITTYNWPESLELVLMSALNQIKPPDEIVIADDGSGQSTGDIISKFNIISSIPIVHSWQKDRGFRAAKSRNKAISKSKFDYIILIDGDTVLHPLFIQDHISNASKGFFVQGSRVLLNKSLTVSAISAKIICFSIFDKGINNRKNAIHSNFMSKIFSTKKNYLRGIKTCNMAFYKKDCIGVNGFNESFIGWGKEDSEFAVRLMNYGIKRKTIRYNSIQYHLWHDQSSREDLKKNIDILQDVVTSREYWCELGIGQYL
jgi:glycosyltransferase involved in cell wall biosynthesis